jgi:hypothetical protein
MLCRKKAAQASSGQGTMGKYEVLNFWFMGTPWSASWGEVGKLMIKRVCKIKKI